MPQRKKKASKKRTEPAVKETSLDHGRDSLLGYILFCFCICFFLVTPGMVLLILQSIHHANKVEIATHVQCQLPDIVGGHCNDVKNADDITKQWTEIEKKICPEICPLSMILIEQAIQKEIDGDQNHHRSDVSPFKNDPWMIISQKIDEWQNVEHENNHAKSYQSSYPPMFIVRMLRYIQTKNPWHLLHAQYNYLHRGDIKADTEFGKLNALQLAASYSELIHMLDFLLNDGEIDMVFDENDQASNPSPLWIAAKEQNLDAAKRLIKDDQVTAEEVSYVASHFHDNPVGEFLKTTDKCEAKDTLQ